MKKITNIFILLLFCVPYAYLSIYLEIAGWALWGYFGAVLAAGVLSAQAKKQNNRWLAIAGNIISTLVSYWCVSNLATEKWTYFCVPFGPVGSVYAIAVIMAFASYAGWVIQKDIDLRKAKKNI